MLFFSLTSTSISGIELKGVSEFVMSGGYTALKLRHSRDPANAANRIFGQYDYGHNKCMLFLQMPYL